MLAEGKILPEQVDEIELPAEEKSHLWKKAVIYYSFATPLVLSVAGMFAIFPEAMFKGQICKLYELAAEENLQSECIFNYTSDP